MAETRAEHAQRVKADRYHRQQQLGDWKAAAGRRQDARFAFDEVDADFWNHE